MSEADPTPADDVLAAYVALQARTPCRKCKASAWTLSPGARWARGGEVVGVFKVLGGSEERVSIVTFTCDGCAAAVERPVYSRAQLATQAYPAVELEPAATTTTPAVKLDVDPHRNGGAAHR